MAQLRQDYEKFVEQDAEVVVVGPDDADDFKKYWSQKELPFIGLPDPEHRVLKLYGQEVNLFKLGRMPAQVIIDKKGLVRYAYYGSSMKDIPSNEEILDLLKKINNADPAD
jgi:peroxiredoxin Q/BCP